jgi:hypothetical protein
LAQTAIQLSSGVTATKGKTSYEHSSVFKNKTGYSWAASAALEIPVSKKLLLQTAIAFTNKKYTVSVPFSSFAGLQRMERCAYLSFKPSLHYRVFKQKYFQVTAGAGLFAAVATGGKYSETDAMGAPAPSPYKFKANLKFGNTVGNNYKKNDAGCSFQITARYKRFILPVMADFSFVSNMPSKYSSDMYGMPQASAETRKWRSLYAGVGYSILIGKKK